MTKPLKSRKWRAIAWFVWLASVPLSVVIVLGVLVAVREYQAARQVAAELQRLNDEGLPYSDLTMTAWYAKQTSREGTAALDEILYLTTSPAIQERTTDLPIVGNGKPLNELHPDIDWPEKSQVAEFLEHARPILQLVHEAKQYPTPVWLPINFEGYGTLLPTLQDSRSVVRLLALDAEYACHERQPERVLQDLHAIDWVTKAIDTQMFLVGELIVMAHRYQVYATINRTLQAELWDAEQLSTVRDLVSQPIDIKTRFQKSMVAERASAFATVFDDRRSLSEWMSDSSPLPMWLLPSGKLRVIHAFNTFEGIAANGLTDRRAVERTERMLRESPQGWPQLDSSGMVLMSIMPSLSAVIQAFERHENNRRLTLTAIGVKQFHLKNQHWPTSLSELEQVGLAAADWTLLSYGPLGYEAMEQGAAVWGASDPKRTGTFSVPAERPAAAVEEDDDIFRHSILIR